MRRNMRRIPKPTDERTPPMQKYLAAYAASLVVMLALDLVWLTTVAKPMYVKSIGDLLADQPNLPAALVFYVVFVLGVMLFAVTPHGATQDWRATLVSGALFGFFTYATYELTNLATLRNWPIGISLLDMVWGSALSAVSAAAGKAVLDRML